jgi:hypothetical protein
VPPHVEQTARPGDVVGARAAGEQAVVADAVEATRQDVDQESADELAGGEYHDLLTIAAIGTIVLPSEGHVGAVAGDQPAVGDGDAVGIARQIGQYGAGRRTGAWHRPAMFARIGVMKALNRHVEWVFNPSRKDTIGDRGN